MKITKTDKWELHLIIITRLSNILSSRWLKCRLLNILRAIILGILYILFRIRWKHRLCSQDAITAFRRQWISGTAQPYLEEANWADREEFSKHCGTHFYLQLVCVLTVWIYFGFLMENMKQNICVNKLSAPTTVRHKKTDYFMFSKLSTFSSGF